MAKLEENVCSTLGQEVISKIERKDLQVCCKAGNLIWYGDGGGDRKDGGKDRGCRAEDGEMGIGGDIEGQGEEQVHLGDGEDQKNWREAEGRETEMVWTCEEKGRKLLRQKNDES